MQELYFAHFGPRLKSLYMHKRRIREILVDLGCFVKPRCGAIVTFWDTCTYHSWNAQKLRVKWNGVLHIAIIWCVLVQHGRQHTFGRKTMCLFAFDLFDFGHAKPAFIFWFCFRIFGFWFPLAICWHAVASKTPLFSGSAACECEHRRFNAVLLFNVLTGKILASSPLANRHLKLAFQIINLLSTS